jgi:hypothetical protein
MYKNITVDTITRLGDRVSAVGPKVFDRDALGNALFAAGTTVPANAGAGFAVGCEFLKTDAVLGQCARWRNQGTTASCQFRPYGPVIGYGAYSYVSHVASAGGDATETLALPSLFGPWDITFTEHKTVGSSPVGLVGQALSNGTLTIKETADPSTDHIYNVLSLRNGCVPGYDIYAAGTHTTAGGDTTEDITISGVVATDIAFATYGVTNDTDVIRGVAAAAGKITVTCSADPSTVHALHYVVFRPRGTFRPSHYIAYAGAHTTVGGAAAEAITVTGAAVGDIPIVQYGVTNDTDTITKAVVTADTITVTATADPSTAHTFNYMLLRAYA